MLILKPSFFGAPLQEGQGSGAAGAAAAAGAAGVAPQPAIGAGARRERATEERERGSCLDAAWALLQAGEELRGAAPEVLAALLRLLSCMWQVGDGCAGGLASPEKKMYQIHEHLNLGLRVRGRRRCALAPRCCCTG